MSHAYINNNTGGGGHSINAVQGDYPRSTEAIPSGNILDTFGGDSTYNDTVIYSSAGIMISTGTAAPGGINRMQAVLTNRGVQNTTTSDASGQTKQILSFDMGNDWYLPNPTPIPATFSFAVEIVGYNETDATGFVYFAKYGAYTDGASGTEIGIEVNDSFIPASQLGTSIDIYISTNDVVFEVTGIAAKTINWRILMTYFTTATPTPP